jgi:tetratricopeptide (TPR) repeat protein
MKPERWQQLDRLFHSALGRASAERGALLDEACAGNETLRKEVEDLLAGHEEAGSFIESPAMEVEARGVAADQGGAKTELPAGETVSHYRIISPLGSGGMGERAHQVLGVSLARQGRLDEYLDEILKARELDPLSPIIARQVALPYYLKRDFGRAVELLRQANELGPALGTTWEVWVYVKSGFLNETLAELEKAKRERKSDPNLIYGTGMIYAAQGKRAEALQIVRELEEMSGASLSQAQYIAKIHAAWNEKELALTWLERAFPAGAIGAFYKDEPVWDTIRSDPRFGDLLRRMAVTP